MCVREREVYIGGISHVLMYIYILCNVMLWCEAFCHHWYYSCYNMIINNVIIVILLWWTSSLIEDRRVFECNWICLFDKLVEWDDRMYIILCFYYYIRVHMYILMDALRLISMCDRLHTCIYTCIEPNTVVVLTYAVCAHLLKLQCSWKTKFNNFKKKIIYIYYI